MTSLVFVLRLNGVLAMGFAPLTWWVPERNLGTDHGTLLMAIFGPGSVPVYDGFANFCLASQ